MPTRYLVLYADAPVDNPREAASASFWRRTRSRRGPSQLSLSTLDGHEHDAGQLRADPKNVAVMDADSLFSLVTPKVRKAVANANIDDALTTLGGQRMAKGLAAVGAHASNFTGQGVKVAVLDTGLDKTHPAFADKQIASRDFTGAGASGDDVADRDGHGTHCAGTICGAVVDGVRVGVAPGVTRLCVGRVLGPSGGSLEMLLQGMLWAVFEQKSDIVSMSLGYDLPGNIARLVDRGVKPALAGQAAMQLQNEIITGIRTLRAFLSSQAPNVVFLAATGNESERPGFVLGAGLPAAELFAVGAVGASGDKWAVAEFSNGRAQCVAPGVDVVSAAAGGGWATMSGTSMATPHAAGVAALWVEKLRAKGELALPDAVRAALLASAAREPLVDFDLDAIGAGMIKAPAQ